MELIKYLPPFVQEYEEIKAIMDGEQVAIDDMWTGYQSTMNNQFILDCDAYGVGRWESMLKLSPKSSDTLDERKFRILTFLNAQLPYTVRRLKEILTNLCGPDGYRVALFNNEYHLIVKLALENESEYNDVEGIVKDMCPANLTLNVYMFNTHKMLKILTHSGMKVYTHAQLRTEII